MTKSHYEELLYVTKDASIKLNVAFDGNMVWLTQTQMALLFSKSQSTINERLKSLFIGDLIESKVMTKFGNSEFSKQRPTQHYSLDAIVKVGEKLNPQRLGPFYEWAQQVLAIGKKEKIYILKHKDIDVAIIELNNSGGIEHISKIINEAHLPVGVVIPSPNIEHSLQFWWKDRSIPASREGLREILSDLNMFVPQQLLEKSLGLSLSDQYWICPKDDLILWGDVNFFHNDFSEDVGDMLFGLNKYGDPQTFSLQSPDNTSDGVLKKRWKIIDGKRCLIKGGTKPINQEVANEVLAASICQRLGIPFVNYWIIELEDGKYCVCEDFIDGNTELVPAWAIKQLYKKCNDESDYDAWINHVKDLGIDDAKRKIDMMLVLDFIIANTDRHFNNFGLIRDANTLAWIGVAPIYDSGTSMWCKELPNLTSANKPIESKPFRSKQDNQIKLVKDFSWLNLDALDGIEIEYADILAESVADPSSLTNRHELLCLLLRKRIELLREIVNSKS